MSATGPKIYRSLFVQARGVLKKELQAHLLPETTVEIGHKRSTNGLSAISGKPDRD